MKDLICSNKTENTANSYCAIKTIDSLLLGTWDHSQTADNFLGLVAPKQKNQISRGAILLEDTFASRRSS